MEVEDQDDMSLWWSEVGAREHWIKWALWIEMSEDEIEQYLFHYGLLPRGQTQRDDATESACVS